VVGRWHDNSHTLVTELAESGTGDEVIMSIAGHVSRAILSRYSHVRMEANRRALDEIAARQRAEDEKRREEAKGGQQPEIDSQFAVVQQVGIQGRRASYKGISLLTCRVRSRRFTSKNPACRPTPASRRAFSSLFNNGIGLNLLNISSLI
jgi:hypothetical protein